MNSKRPYTIKDEKIYMNIYVQPKSSKNQTAGIFDDSFKIKIKAPPVDGAANRECIKYISKLLKIPKSFLSIISGESSKRKKILIEKPNNQTLKKIEENILTIFK